jgi:hypothetical protein
VLDQVADRRESQVGILRLLGDMPFAKDVLVARPMTSLGR